MENLGIISINMLMRTIEICFFYPSFIIYLWLFLLLLLYGLWYVFFAAMTSSCMSFINNLSFRSFVVDNLSLKWNWTQYQNMWLSKVVKKCIMIMSTLINIKWMRIWRKSTLPPSLTSATLNHIFSWTFTTMRPGNALPGFLLFSLINLRLENLFPQ